MRKNIEFQAVDVGSLPFLEAALLAGKAKLDLSYEVLEVSETRKRSGYLIKTDVFQAFVWKNSPACTALLATLDYLLDADPSYALYLELTKSNTDGFTMWMDTEEARLWSKGKKMNVLDVFLSEKIPVTPSKRQKAT
jgi:hypothetical protein